jgi:hypothetical protein
MATIIRDYLPLLKQAIAAARAAGFESEANDLEMAASVAFTTSSEMLQEHGFAIKRFLQATQGRLPRSIQAELYACLNETELAASGWRKLAALMKRRNLS